MGLTCKTHDRLPQHLHVDAYFHCALNSYTEHVKSTVTYQTSRNRGIQKSSCPWRYFSHNKSKSQHVPKSKLKIIIKVKSSQVNIKLVHTS